MTRSCLKIACPTCGRTTVCRVRRTVRVKVGRREIAVRQVEVEECSSCGERMYDLAALARIREARERARRTHAA